MTMHTNILNFPQQEETSKALGQPSISHELEQQERERNLYRLVVMGSWSTTTKHEKDIRQEESVSELMG